MKILYGACRCLPGHYCDQVDFVLRSGPSSLGCLHQFHLGTSSGLMVWRPRFSSHPDFVR
eukprot:6028133-Prorocentrum_lima.AAC.1